MMRPFVSSSVALAVVSLVGSSLAGVSRSATGAEGGEVRPGGFFAPAAELSLDGLGAHAEAPGQEFQPPRDVHAFFFTRAVYSGFGRGYGSWGRGRSWATDFPKADRQFLVVLRRLTNLDAYADAHPVRLDDPEVRRFPFLYAVEVGRMSLTQDEVRGLRDYLNAGGFLVVDDFWGEYEWANFAGEMARVLPGRAIVDLPRDHALFRTFYEIDEILQVPNVGQGRRGGPTHERGGVVPAVKGIFDDDGRLMVVINFNTDLGDAWEWAEDPYYPLRFSTFAYQMGVNMIVYAMSH
jgi:hypothetical protein